MKPSEIASQEPHHLTLDELQYKVMMLEKVIDAMHERLSALDGKTLRMDYTTSGHSCISIPIE